jgi:hypothetical protein
MRKFQIKSPDGLFWDYSGTLINSALNTYLFEFVDNEYLITEDKRYFCYNNNHFYYDANPEFRVKISYTNNNFIIVDIKEFIYIDDNKLNKTSDKCRAQEWTLLEPTYFIVASFPYSFSWTSSVYCSDDSIISFNFINDEIKSGNNYLCYSNGQLYFSINEECKARVIIVPCPVLHNYYIQIAGTNKFIRHYCSELRADESDNSEVYEKDRTWLIIPTLIDERHEVVVARYNEDVRWTRFIPAKIIIYNKGGPMMPINGRDIVILPLQNVGREGHTYLHYIRTRYESLPDVVSFVQGDPLPHGDHIFNMLCMKKYYTPVQSMSAWYSKKPSEERLYRESKVLLNGAQSSRFMFDNEYNYLPGKTHKFYYCGIPCGPPLNKFKYDCSVVQKNPAGYTFMVAGIFSVSAYRIICNPLSFYENCSKILLSKSKQGGREGYSLEFFWATIFGE